MIFYFAIYLIGFFLVLAGSYVTSERTRKFLFFFTYTLLIIVSSIRHNIGIDYSAYQAIYNEILYSNYSRFVYEPLYLLINIICGKLHLGFRGVIVITSIITSAPMLAISNKKNSLFVYNLFFLNYYLYSFCLIRQYVAISFSIIAMYNYVNGKKQKAFLLFLCAIGSHISMSLFVITFYCLKQVKLNKVYVLFLIVFLYLIIIKTDIIENTLLLLVSKTNYSLYAIGGFERQAKGSGLGILLKICIYLLFFYFANFTFKKTSSFNVYLKGFNSMFVIFMVTYFIGIKFRIFARLHFSFLPLLFFPIFFINDEGNRNNKYLSLRDCVLIAVIVAYLIFLPSVLVAWGNIPYIHI